MTSPNETTMYGERDSVCVCVGVILENRGGKTPLFPFHQSERKEKADKAGLIGKGKKPRIDFA